MIAPFNENDLEIAWIPVRQLSVIWVESQRPFNKKHAQKIADKFDFKQFDPVRVTLPNGKGVYHIVEGQHRKEAVVMTLGENQPVPCIILPAADPAEAARLFDGINSTRKRVDPIATFKVRITAGSQTEIAVDRIVNNHGYKVGYHRDGVRIITAVTALMAVFHSNGPKVLSEVLQVLSATWQNDPMATNGNLLRGYGAFFGEFGSKINWGHLKEVMAKKYTPGNLLAWCKQLQDNDGGSISDAVAKTLLAAYNKGLSADKRLTKKSERK